MTNDDTALPDQQSSASSTTDGKTTPTHEESNISLKELESHLFECADIIRNRVDKNDYKEYILPLVFYKSFQDTYQDNYSRVYHEKKDEGLDETTASKLAHDEAFHDYVVPKEFQWADLISSNNTALAVDEALRKFEELNDEFSGISTVEYSSVDAFTQQDDNRLEELLRHLGEKNLSRYQVPPDMLGEAYMDLVKHFAEEEGRDGGEFFTPPKIVELMVKMLEPYEKGSSVHDPTCGSGGMLVQVAEHLQKGQQVPEDHWRSVRFTGQEINPTVYAMAQMNLAIHDVTGEIKKGDSLSDPQFTTPKSTLKQFDYVLANFPFSARWDKDGLQDDPYDRFTEQEKLPRADRGDYAFILHMVKQLNETGQAAIVVPHGVLFRKHESTFREYLIDRDLIEAVVGLPENLFQNVSIPSAILVLNAEKPEQRANQIQFIHAADEDFYRELSNQNELTEDGLDHIIENFREWATEERVSRTVSLDEIRENDYNLNIALYVDTTEPEEEIDVAEELAKLRELQAERDEIEATMDGHMEALQYE